MIKKRQNLIKNMSIEEIDIMIERLPRTFMKACCYQSIKKLRPDYIPKHIRIKEENYDRKSKSKSSR